MTYQEKLKFAEDVAVELKKGVSVEKIEEGLRSKGLYNLDVDKVLFSARSIIAFISSRIGTCLYNNF